MSEGGYSPPPPRSSAWGWVLTPSPKVPCVGMGTHPLDIVTPQPKGAGTRDIQPLTDRQTPMETLPYRNFVGGRLLVDISLVDLSENIDYYF